MKRNLFTTFVFSVLISSCYFKEGNFSAKAPKGWIQIDTVSQNGTKKVRMHPPLLDSMSQFVENINISIVHSRNLDNYIMAVNAEVEKNAKFFKKYGEGIFESKEFEGKWIKHTISSPDFLGNYEQKIYFFKDGRNIYMIVCSAKENEIDKMQSKIDEVINSFKIL